MQVLATIIIDSFNYARFLREAIDSALKQTYARAEIIVVDDGSTDESREIIKGYGSAVKRIFKENGGQGSAINAAFEASRGDIVSFLDSDDAFFPEKVASVVRAFRQNPDASLVYHQLLLVNAEGEKIGGPWPRVVMNGDIRRKVERSGGWWPRPAMTGISCSRSFLEKVLPMPADAYRTCADAHLVGLAPFLGPVTGVRAPQAFYRIHGQNNSRRSTGEEEDRYRLERLELEFEVLLTTLVDRFGLHPPLSIEENPRHQLYQWRTGIRRSRARVLARTARTPAMPPRLKAIELVKIALNR